MFERPRTTAFLAFQIDSGVGKELHDPVRGARNEARMALHQRPDVLGVKTVDVLLGGNGLEHRVDVEVLRQRQLHQNAVDAWIGIELGDFREYHARFDIRRVGQLLGVETGLHTGIDLVAHIDLRSGVFADQDHRQSGAVAARRQRVGALLEVGAQRLRQRVAVEDSCRHFAFPWGGRKRKGAMPRFGAPSESRMDRSRARF
jgi:hypothetical protein